MFLSQLKEEDIENLTVEQMTNIVYSDCEDDGASAPVAILLGGPMKYMDARARAAFELYEAGRVEVIVSTGCASFKRPEESWITQAQYMANLLMKWGVPQEAIILEPEARTTVENMLYSQIQINRRFGDCQTRDVIIVTCRPHLRRSKLTAQIYLPSCINVYGYPAKDERVDSKNWMNDEKMRISIPKNVRLLRKMVLNGQIEDIEF